MSLRNIILSTALLAGCAAPPVVVPQNLFSEEQKFNQFRINYMKMLPENEARVIDEIYELFLAKYEQKDSYCLMVNGCTVPDGDKYHVISAALPTPGNPQRTLVNHLTIRVYSDKRELLLEGKDRGITGKNDPPKGFSTFPQMTDEQFDSYLGRVAKILEDSRKYKENN